MRLKNNRFMQWIILFVMIISVLSLNYSDLSTSFYSNYTEQTQKNEFKQASVNVYNEICTQEMLQRQSGAVLYELILKNSQQRHGQRWENAFIGIRVIQSDSCFSEHWMEVGEITSLPCNENVIRYIHKQDGKKRI